MIKGASKQTAKTSNLAAGAAQVRPNQCRTCGSECQGKGDKTMAEVNAVIGYLPDAAAKSLATGKYSSGPIEVRLEPGNDTLQVRIDPKDVAGVLLGASKKGETGVQVFLNEKAKVETLARGLADDFLKPIKDPILWWHRPPIVVIYAPPIRIKELIAAQQAELVKK
jgi:hypothetical protein